MNRDAWNSDEARIGDVVRGVRVPASAIWTRIPTSRNREPSRTLRPLAVSVGLAVAIGVAGGLLIPRSRTQSPPAPAGAAHVAATPPTSPRSCQLPVVTAGGASEDYGFLSLPTGVYEKVGVRSAGPWAYVAALHRWVATDPADISPDGTGYASLDRSEDSGVIHVVDVHGDRATPRITGVTRLLGYTSSGVVYEIARRGGGVDYFVLTPGSMATRQLPTGHAYQWGGGGALWRLAGGDSAGDTRLVRLDVTTGSERTWLDVNQYLGPEPMQTRAALPEGGVAESPDDHLWHSVGLLGFDDSGAPVLSFGLHDLGTPTMVLLVSAPGRPTAILPRTTNTAETMNASSATTDGAAVVLLGHEGSIWRYEAGSGLTRLSAATRASSNDPLLIAGPCSD